MVGVTYTIWTQGRQLKDQDIQDTRATTLRIYELLKPEVENLAARIISRLRSNPKNQGTILMKCSKSLRAEIEQCFFVLCRKSTLERS